MCVYEGRGGEETVEVQKQAVTSSIQSCVFVLRTTVALQLCTYLYSGNMVSAYYTTVQDYTMEVALLSRCVVNGC